MIIDYPTFKYVNKNNLDPIPKFIYKTASFKFTNIPQKMLEAFREILLHSPDYLIIYFDDNDCDDFIREYFPQYFNDYNQVVPGAFRSDIFRLLILYQYGGIYSDAGQIFLKNIDEILEKNNDLIIVGTNALGIFNAFIASKPNNEIISNMIVQVMYNVHYRVYNNDLLDITGPLALSKALNKFLERDELKIIELGNHIFKNNKVLIHILEIEDNDYANKGYIENTRGDKLIKAKFKEYHQIMYNEKPHYKFYYDNKIVYKNII